MSASTPVITADAVVVGAGPAGAAFALNLAPFQRVLLLEKRAAPALRPGESLPAAARRLLHDMGLWDAFLNQGHRPCHLIRSIWGNNEALEQDAMRDLDGHGWYLDRARFEGWLQRVAQERGAALLTESRLLALRWMPDSGWRLDVQRQGKSFRVHARRLVAALPWQSGSAASARHGINWCAGGCMDRMPGQTAPTPAQAIFMPKWVAGGIRRHYLELERVAF